MRLLTLLLPPLLALIAAGCGTTTATSSAPDVTSQLASSTAAKSSRAAEGSASPTAAGSAATGTTSTTTTPTPPPGPAAAAARLAVERFARGYAAYLSGTATATASEVPDATAQVRGELGPVIPPADRHGPLSARTVPQPGSAGTYLITFADRAHTFLCSATVAQRDGHATVVALVPPDLDTVLSPTPTPLPQPAGSAGPRAGARGFLAGYLALLYGHGTLRQVKDMTGALRARLTAQPAIATPAMQQLHPRLVTLAVTHRGAAWGAKALIADGSSTYELLLILANRNGRWLVASARYPQ